MIVELSDLFQVSFSLLQVLCLPNAHLASADQPKPSLLDRCLLGPSAFLLSKLHTLFNAESCQVK